MPLRTHPTSTELSKPRYVLAYETFEKPYRKRLTPLLDEKHALLSQLAIAPNATLKKRLDLLLREKDTIFSELVMDLKHHVNNGAQIKFGKITPLCYASFFIQKADLSWLKKMVQNHSNVLQHQFSEMRALPEVSPGEQNYLLKQDTLISVLLTPATQSKHHAVYDILHFALANGANPNFMRQKIHVYRDSLPSKDKASFVPTVLKKGSYESLLHQAAKKLDLKAMSLLLDHAADPNLGYYTLEPSRFLPKKELVSGVLKALTQALKNKGENTPVCYPSLVSVLDKLRQRGIKLDAKHGNDQLYIEEIKDATIRQLLTASLYQKAYTQPWYRCFYKKSVQKTPLLQLP